MFINIIQYGCTLWLANHKLYGHGTAICIKQQTTLMLEAIYRYFHPCYCQKLYCYSTSCVYIGPLRYAICLCPI